MLNQIEMVSELTRSGIEQKQADAIVRVQSVFSETLATREYLESRLTVLESRIEAKFEARLGDAKTSIVMWVAGMLVAQGFAIVGLIKFFGVGP